jgi:mannobiose 2-epimerase
VDGFGHDDAHLGYYNVLSLDGKPVGEDPSRQVDETKTPGIKTMNTHIHLLESFTELYRAAPHIVVREKLEELLEIVRDKIAHEPGRLVTRFSEDWTPRSNEDSFGHDVETAYLLLDAADALGKPQDEATLRVARSLVDSPLNHGWNASLGMFADSGEFGGELIDAKTKWWISAEALNALLLMHELFGADTDKYWNAFAAQWRFIQQYHVDPEFGGWYDSIDVDGSPVGTHKAGPWKEAYHETRSMLHVSERLKRLAGL